MHTYNIGPGRQVTEQDGAKETHLLDLEIDEDGTIHLFCGRASMLADDGRRAVFGQLVTGLTARVLRSAVTVAGITGYTGPWVIGIALNNLRQATAYQNRITIGIPPAPVYSHETYRRVREIPLEAIADDEQHALESLLGPLCRALALETPHIADLFGPPRPSLNIAELFGTS